jgi:hypothetical protein
MVTVVEDSDAAILAAITELIFLLTEVRLSIVSIMLASNIVIGGLFRTLKAILPKEYPIRND